MSTEQQSIAKLRNDITLAATAFHIAFAKEQSAERIFNAIAVKIATDVESGRKVDDADIAAFRLRRDEYAMACLKCNEADERLSLCGRRFNAAVDEARAKSSSPFAHNFGEIGAPPCVVGGVSIPKRLA